MIAERRWRKKKKRRIHVHAHTPLFFYAECVNVDRSSVCLFLNYYYYSRLTAVYTCIFTHMIFFSDLLKPLFSSMKNASEQFNSKMYGTESSVAATHRKLFEHTPKIQLKFDRLLFLYARLVFCGRKIKFNIYIFRGSFESDSNWRVSISVSADTHSRELCTGD